MGGKKGQYLEAVLIILTHTPHLSHTNTHTLSHTHTHPHLSHTNMYTHTLSSHTHTHSASSRNRCCIRFLLSRVHMRSMHYAVDHLDLDTIFPPSQSVSVKTETPISIKRCLEELKNSELYSSQQNAITSMLNPACRQVSTCTSVHACKNPRTTVDWEIFTLKIIRVKIFSC